MTHRDRLRLLALDDERPALDDLVRILRSVPRVGEVTAAACATDALRALVSGPAVDGVFLDVRMPGIDGLELARVLRRLQRPPALVFVSGYDRYAADAFELAALDFLVKPVTRRQLEKAVERVAQVSPLDGDVAPRVRLSLDDGRVAVDAPHGGMRFLARASILVLQAHSDYVRVFSDEGRFLLRARLAGLEQEWSAHGFLRVHRGFVVNLHRVVELRTKPNGTAALVMSDGRDVPVARRYAVALRPRLTTAFGVNLPGSRRRMADTNAS